MNLADDDDNFDEKSGSDDDGDDDHDDGSGKYIGTYGFVDAESDNENNGEDDDDDNDKDNDNDTEKDKGGVSNDDNVDSMMVDGRQSSAGVGGGVKVFMRRLRGDAIDTFEFDRDQVLALVLVR